MDEKHDSPIAGGPEIDRTSPAHLSDTITRRVWYTRGASIFFLLVLVTVGLMGVSVREIVLWWPTADTGITLSYFGPVKDADARWPGLERGDRVVEINGTAVPTGAHPARALLAVPIGETTVRFQRADRTWELRAEARPRSLSDRAAVVLRGAVALALMLVGTVAFVLRPGTQSAWLLFLFSIVGAWFQLAGVALERAPEWQGAVLASTFLMAAGACVHLLAVFPQTLPTAKRHPRAILGLHALNVACGLAAVVVFFAAGDPTLSARVYSGTMITVGVETLFCIGLVVQQVRVAGQAGDARASARVRAVALGVLLGLGLPVVLNTIRLTAHVFDSPVYRNINGGMVILFVFITAYSLIRHNALDVDRFTAAIVGYGASLALLGLILMAVLLLATTVLGEVELFDSPVVWVAMTAGGFLGFTPIYRRVKRHIDRRFFRESAGAGRASELLRELGRTVQVGDRSRVYASAVDAAMSLLPDGAQLWLLSDDEATLERVAAIGASPDTADRLSRRGALVRALADSKEGGGLDGLAPTVFGREAQAELWTLGLALATPVVAHGVSAGFIGLGRKRSGLGFTDEELSFLGAVATEIAHALERATSEGAQFGRYRIERRLGTGGMAEVFLAWQLGPGGFERKVALKRPLPHLSEDPDCVAMLLDEARIAAQLQHRNIVQVYEIDRQGGPYFIAMEFVDGPTLRQVLKQVFQRGETVPLPITLAVAVGILNGLAYAHEQCDASGQPLGLVHRDVTPGNVLFSRAGDVKLADFGIARAAHRLHATRTGLAKGTLPYMSPEQALGREIDRRSDLFSTALVLFEMLTGRRAMPDGPLRSQPPSPLGAVPALPAQLALALERALTFDPGPRYATAEAMLDALVASAPEPPAGDRSVAAWLQEVTDARTSRAEAEVTGTTAVVASTPSGPERGQRG